MKPAVRIVTSSLLALTVLCASLPVIALVVDIFALSGDGAGGSALSFDSRQARLFARSLLVAATSTLLATVWGLSTAIVISRRRGRLGLTVEALSYLPLVIPNIVLVIGWIHILGPGGYLARGVEWLTGVPALSSPVLSSGLMTPWGAGFVLSLCYFPYVTITCARGLSAIRESALRSAELHAGLSRRLLRIWLPFMAPYLATGVVLVFLQSFSDYSVPSALMVNVYPVEIFAQLSSFHDVHGALKLCAPPLGLALVLCSLRYLGVRRAPFSMHPTPSGSGSCPRVVLAAAVIAVAASSVLPLTFLAVKAGTPAVYVRAMKMAGAQILASLEVACWGALLFTSLALVFAAAYRWASRGARAVAEIGVISLLGFPGAVVGLGVLSLREAGVLDMFGDHAILVAYASGCRYFAVPALILAFSVLALRSRLIDAAAIHGGGRGRILVRIVLPVVLPAVFAAAAVSFVLTLAELSASVLVYPPGGMTLPVRLASLLHFGEESVVAALCVMVSAFIAGVVLLGRLVINRPLRLGFYRERQP